MGNSSGLHSQVPASPSLCSMMGRLPQANLFHKLQLFLSQEGFMTATLIQDSCDGHVSSEDFKSLYTGFPWVHGAGLRYSLCRAMIPAPTMLLLVEHPCCKWR